MHKESPEHTDPMENLYRKSFEGFRAEPSQDVLAKIKSKLPEEKVRKSSWGKSGFFWLIFTSVVLSIVFFIFYDHTDENRNAIQPFENNNTIQKTIRPVSPGSNQLKADKEESSVQPVKKTFKQEALESFKEKDIATFSPDKDSKGVDSLLIKETVEEKDLQLKPVEKNKEEMTEDPAVDFYQKRTKSYKDSVRNLFGK